MSNKRNRSSKSDQIKVKGQLKELKQNPNWYFKDAVQADVLSRIQMNAFGALTKIGNQIPPSVCVFYANPCPGVTRFQDTQVPGTTLFLPGDAQSKGINRAAQKLWYILTCKSGRAAGYTKADVALLLLAMGATIETYEFIRRGFGIAYTYNQRNRALPTMLYKAMNIDMHDYQANAAVYLKRMNSLMAIMNQLPIPGNVAWFAKCQDIYQNIYMDYPSEMAQLFMICPSTTWILEENDGFIGGSYLRTVDMCITHRDSSASDPLRYGLTSGGAVSTDATGAYNCTRYDNQDASKTLGDYIDVFEDQINNLLFSTTFSQIYSDILRAFDNGALSRWSFDYIDEKYIVTPVFDDSRLWMFHNASTATGVLSLSRSNWQSKWTGAYTYDDVFKYGTCQNDVVQWAPGDVLIYNPCVSSFAYVSGGSQNVIPTFPLVTDFPSDAPTTEERIDYTRYMFAGYDDVQLPPDVDDATIAAPLTAVNVNLPDHWFELTALLFGEADGPELLNDRSFYDQQMRYNLVDAGHTVPASNSQANYTKFHHGKLLRQFNSTTIPFQAGSVYGELNAWTFIDREWFNSINDMIYVDLFDIR